MEPVLGVSFSPPAGRRSRQGDEGQRDLAPVALPALFALGPNAAPLPWQEALAALSADLGERGWCNGESYSLADITVGCCLGYLDFRFEQIDWRASYPNLARLAGKLATRPSFAETVPTT